MNARRLRKYKARWKLIGSHRFPYRQCPNCGEVTRTGHFIPPSLREEGRFICLQVCKTPDIPDSFKRGAMDIDAGKVIDMEKALYETPGGKQDN